MKFTEKEKIELQKRMKESAYRCYRGSDMHKTKKPCDSCKDKNCWERKNNE